MFFPDNHSILEETILNSTRIDRKRLKDTTMQNKKLSCHLGHTLRETDGWTDRRTERKP